MIDRKQPILKIAYSWMIHILYYYTGITPCLAGNLSGNSVSGLAQETLGDFQPGTRNPDRGAPHRPAQLESLDLGLANIAAILDIAKNLQGKPSGRTAR